MNKQRKTSHILNVFQYDETTGAVTLPSTLVLTAPAGSDNSTKVPTTAWTRSYISSLGYVTGNQSISITGDATGSGSTSIELTLANTAVTPGTYGSATLVPVVTVDSKGRITSVTTAAISGALTFTGDVTGTGTTGSSTTLTLANSGVTAGTFTKVTVDSKGRVTVGASATTSDISEGTNLYYTDARVLAYLGANNYATQSYVGTQINNLVAGAPGLLDTLDELAAALGDDANFATTTATSLGNRLRIDTAAQGLTSTQQGYGRTNLGLGSAALSATGDFATAAQGTKADTAHGWGNHASAGYLTTSSAASTYVSLTGSYANPSWITSLAYSKITGVPAFLTSYTETDTLNSVTGRGATTSNTIQIGKLGIGRAAGSNESISVENPEGTWLIQGFRSGSSVGGLHTNSGVLYVQAADVRIQASSTATWNGDTLATRPWVTSQGYITGYSETDTLATVTARGASTTAGITVNGRVTATGGGTYAVTGSSTQRYIIQALNTSNSVNSSYGWWWFHNTNGDMGFHADAVGDILTLTRGGGFTINGNTVLTTGNYTSYSPSLTGGGASGNWGISITGSAGSVAWSNVSGKPTTLSGYGITDSLYQSRATLNVNDFPDTGLYRGSTSGWTNRPTVVHNGGALLHIDTHPGGYYAQLFFDSGGNRIYMRSADAYSWQSWVTIINSGNYNSYSPTLTGGGASGTWGISITGNADTVDGYHASGLWKLNEWNGNLYAHTDGRIYGTIFYDANNSDYYLDPNSTGISSNNAGGAVFRNIQISSASLTDTIQNVNSGGNIWLNYGHNGPVGLGYGGGLTTAYNGLTINGIWQTNISTSGGWTKLSFTASNNWGDGVTYGTLGASGGAEPGVMINNMHATWAGTSNGAGIRMGRSGGVSSGAWYQVATMSGDEFMIAKTGDWANGGIKILSNGAVNYGNTGYRFVHNNGTWDISINGNADTVDGRHATNAASGLAIYESNGYLYVPSWINVNGGGIFASTNNAHIRPNTGSYGAWEMIGSRNGWSGIWFNDSSDYLMANSNEVGHYQHGIGWKFRWYQGTMYVSRGTTGGGSEFTVLDSGNYTNWAQGRVYQGQSSGDWQNFTNDVGEFRVDEVLNITSGAHSNYPTGVYTYGGVMSWRLNNHSFQLYASHTGDLAYKTQWGNDNYSGWRRILDSSTYPHAANMNQYVRTSDNVSFNNVNSPTGYVSNGNPWGTSNSAFFPNGITTAGGTNWIYGYTYIGNAPSNGAGHEFFSSGSSYSTGNVEAGGSMRAPIFYDRNDTTYYLDPNSTSRLESVWVRGANFYDGRLYVGGSSAGSGLTMNFDQIWTGSGNLHLQYSGSGNIDMNYGGGYTFSRTSLRAPIFYDYNDTNFYLDPNGSSVLNTVYLTGTLRNNGSVSDDDGFGVYWDSGASTAYAIYREGGSWSWPYPDLRIAFHTGIKIGANAGYGGMKFYSDYDMSTIVASINDGDTNMRGYYDIIAYASDRRLKENVQVIDNAIDKVKQLTGMTYTWNSVGAQYGWSPSNEREAGVFAQDVQAVLPEAVRLAPFDNHMGVSKSGENFLTVKYEKIVPLLIEAIKEQQKQIEELQNKLDNVLSSR